MKRVWRRYPGTVHFAIWLLRWHWQKQAGWTFPCFWTTDGAMDILHQSCRSICPWSLCGPQASNLGQARLLAEAEGPSRTLSSSSSFCCTANGYLHTIIISFMTPHSWGLLITIRHTTRGRTPLGDWSARRRDLYLTTHNIHDIHAPTGFQTRSPSKWATADRRLRQRGHWDGRVRLYGQLIKMINIQASIRRCCLNVTSYRSDGWGGKNGCPFTCERHILWSENLVASDSLNSHLQ